MLNRFKLLEILEFFIVIPLYFLKKVLWNCTDNEVLPVLLMAMLSLSLLISVKLEFGV